MESRVYRNGTGQGDCVDTGLLIALLNPGIALVLSGAFLALWLHQRARRYLAVLSIGYACASAGFLLQYFTLPVGFAATKLASVTAFTVGVGGVGSAIIMHYGRRLPWLGLGIPAVLGFCAYCWFLLVQPDLTWRILATNFAFGGISLVVAAELRTISKTSLADRFLFALTLLIAANFILRTLLVVAAHGPFGSYADFHTSTYWTTALLSHALLSLMLALTLLTAAALDTVTALRVDSHTDPLSGLLNRRGFEERAGQLLDRCATVKFPVALVLADLDHFKTINDVHGHEAGDRVIADFAGRLRLAAGNRGVAGRLGGEEFAVLLPLADLAAARLFAEAVRTVFSAGTVDGLPVGMRVTASFGVAARSAAEPLAPLMRRADEALYKAKQSGRDSVRISYERPVTPAGDRMQAG
jgi:diguanylate cyclase (GGDEF)-like protein